MNCKCTNAGSSRDAVPSYSKYAETLCARGGMSEGTRQRALRRVYEKTLASRKNVALLMKPRAYGRGRRAAFCETPWMGRSGAAV
mmetsp:Transcript_4188/g.17779  ORF Transcript_4188/g.17779 Transcript_4188/m.17779 type:complete len:85 (-) Transcript_4188:322-576(-)